MIEEAVPGFKFGPGSDRVARWVEVRGTELAVNLADEQHRAMRAILRQYTLAEPLPVDEVARRLRAVIGLTQREAQAVERMRQRLLDAGEDAVKAEHVTQNYAGWLSRRRALRIARTEQAFAYNYGHFESMRQVQDQPLFGPEARVVKVFRTAENERVCPYCGPLEGAVIGLEETFPGGTRRLPAVFVPPLHPHCQCAVEYQVLRPGDAEPEPGAIASSDGVNTEPDADFDTEIQRLLASPNRAEVLVGEVAQAVRNDLVALHRKVGPHASIGEVDVETSTAIIEVTMANSGKLSQVVRLIQHRDLNPESKPVILYAPRYLRVPERDITNVGAHVVRNIDQLLKLLQKLGGER